jgi:alkylation response protein AidB-like acyl-CoA dehydrogenase
MSTASPTVVGHNRVSAEGEQLRARTREICGGFPDEYWRERDLLREYPLAFVGALTEAGLLAALIPKHYGGLGVGVSDAAGILEEIKIAVTVK